MIFFAHITLVCTSAQRIGTQEEYQAPRSFNEPEHLFYPVPLSSLLQFWTGPACPRMWLSSAEDVTSVPSAAPVSSEGLGATSLVLPTVLEASLWESW